MESTRIYSLALIASAAGLSLGCGQSARHGEDGAPAVTRSSVVDPDDTCPDGGIQ